MWSELRKIWHETPSGNPSGNPSIQIDQDASANKEQSPHKVSGQRRPRDMGAIHRYLRKTPMSNWNWEIIGLHIVSHGYIKLHPNRMILEPHVPPFFNGQRRSNLCKTNSHKDRWTQHTRSQSWKSPEAMEKYETGWNRGIFKLPANGLLMIVS